MPDQYSTLRIERGLCVECGEKHGGRGQRCPRCSQKRSEYMRWFIQDRMDRGLCTKCGLKNDRKPKTLCSPCSEKQSISNKLRAADRGVKGHCKKCPAKSVFGRGLCFDHWCASTAGNTLGEWARGPELKRLWERQGGLCAMTGEPLDKDAQIDHIKARSRGGGNTIRNLQWVCGWVNAMKNDYTVDEFIARCLLVVRYAKKR